ncbi:MAG TPA: flavodoxin family protein [Spirochaetia bacterium]|nr:flavodoxin family protein [Spirochaetia bacterium]
MKILILQSSGRTNGNTARVVSLVQESLRDTASRRLEDLQVEVVHLARRALEPCRGCRSCFDRGEQTCPSRDDLLSLKARMQEADGLVLAGPVYVNDVNGTMKTWIDRLAHVCHRPEFAGKTALLVATTADTPARHALRTMQVALWTWGYRIAGSAWFKTGALMTAEEVCARHGERIRRCAGKLHEEIRTRRFLKPSFLSLMIFRIQQEGWRRTDPASIDHGYWKDRGWLDRRRTFFFDHRTSPLITGAARLVGSIAAAAFL